MFIIYILLSGSASCKLSLVMHRANGTIDSNVSCILSLAVCTVPTAVLSVPMLYIVVGKAPGQQNCPFQRAIYFYRDDVDDLLEMDAVHARGMHA